MTHSFFTGRAIRFSINFYPKVQITISDSQESSGNISLIGSLILIIKGDAKVSAVEATPTRRFGQSSLQLPLLGFGAAPIGNLYQAVTNAVAHSAVATALEAGINYIDCAPHYGFGLAEQRVGNVLQQHPLREKALISTKVGRLLVPTQSSDKIRYGFVVAPVLEPVFDYSYDAVMRSFHASLKRLQCDRIDILLAHDLGEVTHGAAHPARFREFMDGGYRAMQELRDNGLVGAIGLGANEWQVCEQALAHGDFDGFLLAGRYTLLEQSAAESFLPLCARRKVSVIVGGVFNSGILASGVNGKGPFYYNYEPAPSAIIARVKSIENICQDFSVPLAAAALQFPIAHPQICSVVAGFADSTQVTQAAALMNTIIPAGFWSALRDQALMSETAPLPGESLNTIATGA